MASHAKSSYNATRLLKNEEKSVYFFVSRMCVCVREGNINKSNADKRPQKDKG